MASDTAQAVSYPPADPVADAAAQFKALREPAPQPVRDDAGRFARPAEPEPVQEEIEAQAPEAAAEVVDEQDVEAEAAEEAQPEPIEMPSSWSKEDAELWDTLPAEAQAKLAEREAEQNRGLNQKFQTVANERKALEASLAEANANRTKYAEQLDTLLGAIQPVAPDPRAFGAGTGQFHQEAFELAKLEYQQQSQALAQLTEQRDAIRTQEQQEQEQQFQAWRQEQEAEYAPKFIADVPELTDPAKADPTMRGLIDYAISNGIPADTFAEANQSRIMSAELHVLWKAMQYDKQQEAKTRVAPKAKPAAPPVRPGAATPRATQQSIALQKDMKRLAATGTIEAGAAVFKHFRKT